MPVPAFGLRWMPTSQMRLPTFFGREGVFDLPMLRRSVRVLLPVQGLQPNDLLVPISKGLRRKVRIRRQGWSA